MKAASNTSYISSALVRIADSVSSINLMKTLTSATKLGIFVHG